MKDVFTELMSGLDDVESYLSGATEGFKVHVPDVVDVKQIRHQLHMTQLRFSDCFGFSLDAVKHWEGGRRQPEASARAFLTVIARNPDAVIAALHPAVAGKTHKSRSTQGRKVTTKAHHPAL
jgi:putative transcriptional regulator